LYLPGGGHSGWRGGAAHACDGFHRPAYTFSRGWYGTLHHRGSGGGGFGLRCGAGGCGTAWATQRLAVTGNARHPIDAPTDASPQIHAAPAVNVLRAFEAGWRHFGRPAQGLGGCARYGCENGPTGNGENFEQHNYPHVAFRDNESGLFLSKGQKPAILYQTSDHPHPLVLGQYNHGRSDGCQGRR